jgi:hypothetical protein
MLAKIRRRHVLIPGVAGAALLGAGLLGAAPAAGDAARAAGPVVAAGTIGSDSVPPEIRVPPGNRLITSMLGRGVQVYQCHAGAWAFLEPVAELQDSSPAAVHFRGPSWESIRDGSLVEAATVASSPVVGSIPQLLLQETLTRGDGVFGHVTYVQRLDTTGGVRPSTACTEGQTQGVPYTSKYLFYARG